MLKTRRDFWRNQASDPPHESTGKKYGTDELEHRIHGVGS